MRYVSVTQILQAHELVLRESGGSPGIRDMNLVESACALPQQSVFGKELYATVFEKAAVYMRTLARNHPFVDANKRTAIVAAQMFLGVNGLVLVVVEKELVRFAVDVVEKKLTIAEIAAWLEAHAQKNKPR